MKKIFAIAISILSISNSNAQSFDRSIRPSAGPAPTINMADAQTFTLPNGLKVFVVENHKLPTVSYQIDLDVNPALQGNAVGYQDMIGDLLSGGTKTKSKAEFNKQLDALGGRLSASSDGVFATCLTKQQDGLLALMSEMILEPNFSQVELDKIKKKTMSGLATNRDDPNAMSDNLIKSLVFGKNHSYGEITTENTVKNINLEMCKKYYNTYFKPNASYMAVVGDITLDQAKTLVTKYFSKWQKGVIPEAKYSTPKNNTGARVAIVNKTGAVQSVLNITYPVNLKYGTPDVIKTKVANAVLGGGSNGRLFQNLREGHGWTYGSYSSINADKLENSGMFSATADCQTESTDSSVAAIIYEMNKMRTEPVADKLLNDIKTNMAGKFALSLEDPKTLARNAINIEKYKMPKDYYRNYLKSLAAVNATDVMDASKKYINPNVAYITVAGDRNEIAPKLAKFAASGKVENYDMYGNPEKEIVKTAPAKAENVKAEDIINNYILAVGGMDNWTNIKDITSNMELSAQGQKLIFTEIKKSPNKYLSTIKMGENVVQKKVFNGTKGKVSGMQGEKDMEADDIAEMKNEANYLGEVAFLSKDNKLEVKGTEKVNGKDAYVVKVTDAKGKSKLYYYDVASKLKVKSSETAEMGEQKISVNFYYSNYQDIKGGMKMPYSISQEMGPQKFDIKVKSIELNSGVDDKIFE